MFSCSPLIPEHDRLQIQHTSALVKQSESIQKMEALSTSVMTRIEQYGSSLNRMKLTSHIGQITPQSQTQGVVSPQKPAGKTGAASRVCRCPRQLTSYFPGSTQMHRPNCP
ncbi:hypothetical protein BJX65DRAFT_289443 [Aspergillus insuetus]